MYCYNNAKFKTFYAPSDNVRHSNMDVVKGEGNGAVQNLTKHQYVTLSVEAKII